jgi:hypothetical protein
MARRPKNPIDDISKLVGGWLGGSGPGTNPQVRAAMQATRGAARAVDTATGGFGQALVSDAQRMAQTGSSTPSALYKTAAVNLAAAATGAAAAKVLAKTANKLAQTGPAIEAKYALVRAANKANMVLPKHRTAFNQIQEDMWESGYFDQGHGGLGAIYDPRKFEDVIESGYLSKRQVSKINKDAKKMRTDSVIRELNRQKKNNPKRK